MKQPSIDPERIAALIDGQLGKEERDALLADLARSDDDLDALGDLAELIRDAEESEPVPQPAPLAENDLADRRRKQRLMRVGMMAAAAAVAFVSIGIVRRQLRDGALPSTPAQVVALVDQSPNVAPLRAVSWASARSAIDSVPASVRAIRFGLRATELELAIARGDSAGVTQASRELAALLDQIAGTSAPSGLYRDLAAQPGKSASLRTASHDAWDSAAPLVGIDDARIGAWLGGALAAASAHDLKFFQRRSATVGLNAVNALATRRDAETAARTTRVADALRIQNPDWASVEGDLAALAKLLASR